MIRTANITMWDISNEIATGCRRKAGDPIILDALLGLLVSLPRMSHTSGADSGREWIEVEEDHTNFRFYWDELAGLAQEEVADLRQRSSLPDGYEWPRFKEGQLVRLGDRFGCGDETHVVDQISFERHRPDDILADSEDFEDLVLIDTEDFEEFWSIGAYSYIEESEEDKIERRVDELYNEVDRLIEERKKGDKHLSELMKAMDDLLSKKEKDESCRKACTHDE